MNIRFILEPILVALLAAILIYALTLLVGNPLAVLVGAQEGYARSFLLVPVLFGTLWATGWILIFTVRTITRPGSR